MHLYKGDKDAPVLDLRVTAVTELSEVDSERWKRWKALQLADDITLDSIPEWLPRSNIPEEEIRAIRERVDECVAQSEMPAWARRRLKEASRGAIMSSPRG